MSPLVARDGRSGQVPVEARTVRLGGPWYLVVLPLPTSMPIPLAVARPEGVALVGWSFAGMDAGSETPTCLLLVSVGDAEAGSSLDAGGALVVTTHFREIAAVAGPALPAGTLSPSECEAAAVSLLSSVTSERIANLAELVPLLTAAVRNLPAATDAPTAKVEEGTPLRWSVTGADVPNYLLLASEAGMGCARVRSARIAFDPSPRMDLDLEPVWGPDAAGPVDRVVLVGAGRFTAARLPEARA